MLRNTLLVLALVIGSWALIDLFVTTDREAIAARLEEIFALTLKGGPEAAAELKAAISDDYEGMFGRRRLFALIDRYVATGKVSSVSYGKIKVSYINGHFVVPLLRLDVIAEGQNGVGIVALTVAQNDGVWQISSMRRWGR